ncbi:MAG: metallophosphoesterase [Bryobacter sp.]|nr:metallophosphoesterase [Bryobacter sp.]
MLRLSHVLEVSALLALGGAQVWLLRRLTRMDWAGKVVLGLSLAPVLAAVLSMPVWGLAPHTAVGQYLRAGALLWSLLVPLAYGIWWWVGKQVPEHQSARRMALKSLAAVPVAASGFGIVTGRRDFHVEEVRLVFPGLPAALDGLKIVQVSDIHYGPFLGKAELKRVVGMANELNGDVVTVTGDLITRTTEYLPECLQLMRELRSPGTVYACMGNHEGYAKCEDEVERETAKMGWKFLRSAKEEIRLPGAVLSIGGEDYQWAKKDYLKGGAAFYTPGAFNVLLAHNPDVFDRAAALGFDLQLSGHTHGGQVDVELLDQHLNLVRAITPYTKGRYAIGKSQCYVNAGIGTIGVPLRIGASPEVALIRLCAS